MSKIDKKFRQQFVTIVQTGALTFDRRYNKRIAHELVYNAMIMPDELFTEEDYSPFTYACNLLDFEYGLFDKYEEEYPEWIEKYFKWKMHRY